MTKPDTPPPLLTPADLDLEHRVAAFEAAYRKDRTTDLIAFLPPVNHVTFGRVLRELICVDLEFAWERGERRLLESYRSRLPQLFDNPQHLREAAREEYRLRKAAGETPSPSEYGRRFGTSLFDSSASLFATQATSIFDTPTPASINADTLADDSGRLPVIGETIVGFQLLSILGEGAFGKVYLARESGLAGRLVALKVSSRFPGEAQTLARLQHSNIMPIYSVHRRGALHLICMPWLGGTTFADMIQSVRGAASLPVSAQSVLSTLNERAERTRIGEEPHTPVTPRPPLVMPTIRQLEQSSFVDAVLSFGEQLAEGLAHAHARGVLHRDLKPANILLADDGCPMLLDFNLAADDVHTPREMIGLGGTLRYMAPEVIAALAARRGLADPRADLYSLGLILYELLTGQFPFATLPASAPLAEQFATRQVAMVDPRVHRKDLAPGVASILQKCLQANPADRYAAAADMAEDLRRQRTNLPLQYAANTSLRERLVKWARRHPRLSSSASLGTLAVTLLTVGIVAYLSQQRHLGKIEAEYAFHTLKDERDSVRMLLVSPETPRRFLVEARDRATVQLNRYDAWNPESLAKNALLADLSSADRDAARRDLGAVFAEYSVATRLLARGDNDPQRKNAMLVHADFALDQAVALRPGRGDLTDTVRDELGKGQYRKMLDSLDNAGREVSPAAWFARGHAHFKLGEMMDAVRAYDVALVQAPGMLIIRYERGLALQALKRWDAAIADYSALLAADATDADSLLNRALCYLELQDTAAAIRDLNQLEGCEAPPSRLYFIRERARRMAGDDRGAGEDFAKGLATPPTDPLSFVSRGRARLQVPKPDVAAAFADFEAAVAIEETLCVGWENIAETLSERMNRPADALTAQNRVVALNPASVSPLAGRAVLHARLKHRAEAQADVEATLKLKPDSLAIYQAACARLLIAETDTDRAAGLALLRDALRKDPSWAAAMETDADLKSVHGAAEFRRLTAAARTLTATPSAK